MILEPPPGEELERVRLHLHADQRRVRQQRGQGDRGHDGGDGHPRRSRQTAFDPGEERREEERREVEHVPLLDALNRRQRREGGDLDQQPDAERDRCGDERLRGPVEPPRQQCEDDECGERKQAEVEVELGGVVEEPLENRADRVVLVARRLVRAERRDRRVAAGELDGEHDHDRRTEDPVQPAEREQAPPRRSPPPGQQERGGRKRGHERDRLRPRLVRERGDREQDELAKGRRSLEAQHQGERRADEDRIEGVLGHHRPGVQRRGDGDGEERREQGQRGRDHAAGEEVRRDGGQRHQDGVDRLRGRVGLRQRREEPVRRADQERIDDAVRAARLPADEEVTRGREALRELRVDHLVDHDPGRDHPPPEAPADDDRRTDEREEPEPGGDRAGDGGRLRAHPGARRLTSRQA